MVTWMFSKKMVQEPLMMLMCFHLYLRRGEVTQLRVKDLVPPVLGGSKGLERWSVILHPLEEENPSKTMEFDETLLFDLDDMVFIAEAVHRLMKLGTRSKEELVFSRTVAQLRAKMEQASSRLGLEALSSPHPYRLRHGGASFDFQTRSRSLLEIQRRGRWKSYSSVRRYEKGGRVSQLLQSLPKDALQKLIAAAKNIETMLRAQR